MNCAVTLLYAVDQLLDSSVGVAAFSVMKHYENSATSEI